jgi:hypothetical protein
MEISYLIFNPSLEGRSSRTSILWVRAGRTIIRVVSGLKKDDAGIVHFFPQGTETAFNTYLVLFDNSASAQKWNKEQINIIRGSLNGVMNRTFRCVFALETW